MVSLQAALSPEDRKACPVLENSLCKKRKCRDGEASEDDWFVKEAKFVKAEEDDIRLNLDAPLPLEWQRCLDLKVDRRFREGESFGMYNSIQDGSFTVYYLDLRAFHVHVNSYLSMLELSMLDGKESS